MNATRPWVAEHLVDEVEARKRVATVAQRARALMTAARVFVWAADIGEPWLLEHAASALGPRLVATWGCHAAAEVFQRGQGTENIPYNDTLWVGLRLVRTAPRRRRSNRAMAGRKRGPPETDQ